MFRKRTSEKSNADQMIDETLESAKRSLSFLKKSEQAEDDILEALYDQADHMDATQRNVDEVLYREKIAKRQTRTISSIFWAIWNKIKPWPSRFRHADKVNEEIEMSNMAESGSTGKINDSLTNNFIDTSVLSDENADKIKQTDEILEEMEDYVEDLGEKAEEMGKEIRNHNKRLDVLSETTDEAIDNQVKANTDIDRLLNRF